MKDGLSPAIEAGEFALVLDDIRDPGNLGTILRTADWYGIRTVVASPSTADFYNPKVISATMGSFTRIGFFNEELEPFLANANGPIYGAFLDGKNVHHEKFEGGGLVVIGNESRGISQSLESSITHKITIPRYGQAESLNAAVATAILCDNIRRNNPA
jgi:TrmH family RNA methyltransferase